MNIFAVREEEPVLRFPVADSAPAVIKVVGTGGGGSNAVNHMIKAGLNGVEFIAVNTDLQHLSNMSLADTRLQIGSKVTGGRGAGGIPEKGEKAALEDQELISGTLRGADMVFVTAGMGGGTGTGSAPIIAQTAKEMGALTIGVVTKPFEHEGRYRMKIAEEGIRKLRETVDTLIVIPNEYLFKKVENTTSFDQSRLMADDVLRQGVQGISDIITKTGVVNTDFADVETIMKGQGDAIMGIGIGSGENRARDAASAAIDNPMLEDTNIDGATNVLVNIAGPRNMTLVEIKEAITYIRSKVDPDVNLIHGVFYEDELENSVRVTVIATGLKNNIPQVGKSHGTVSEPRHDIIDLSEFERMREQSKQKQLPGYLGLRNCSEDLDIPPIIREHNYGYENRELKVSNARNY